VYVERSLGPRSRSHAHSTLCSHAPRQVPFRETHHISGRAVALAETLQTGLADLSLEQYQQLSPKFSDDVFADVFDFERSIEKRNAIGGPSREMVTRQVKVLRELLK
jgi:argininosuccinate lyase